MLLAEAEVVAHAPAASLVGRDIDHGHDDATLHELTPDPDQEVALAELDVPAFRAEPDVAAAPWKEDSDRLRLLGDPGQEIGLRHAGSRGQRDDFLSAGWQGRYDRDRGQPEHESRHQHAARTERPPTMSPRS